MVEITKASAEFAATNRRPLSKTTDPLIDSHHNAVVRLRQKFDMMAVLRRGFTSRPSIVRLLAV
jgi:hypothetical protein